MQALQKKETLWHHIAVILTQLYLNLMPVRLPNHEAAEGHDSATTDREGGGRKGRRGEREPETETEIETERERDRDRQSERDRQRPTHTDSVKSRFVPMAVLKNTRLPVACACFWFVTVILLLVLKQKTADIAPVLHPLMTVLEKMMQSDVRVHSTALLAAKRVNG